MRVVLFIGVGAIQLFSLSAMAQFHGEADPAQAKAPPVASFGPAERAIAARERVEQGSVAARALYGSDLHQPVLVVTLSREQREAAANRRHAEVSALNKARLLPLASDLDYPPSPPGRIR